MQPIDIALLETVFRRLERNGVVYGLGSKAPALDCDTSIIKQIDCSGFTRYAIAKATNQQLIVPDGSQNQLDWAMRNLRRLGSYSDVVYANPARLFWCFIKVNTNGCGDVGHTWFVTKFAGSDTAMTMESHGGSGGGIDSRQWNYSTLFHEAYAAFELPVRGAA